VQQKVHKMFAASVLYCILRNISFKLLKPRLPTYFRDVEPSFHLVQGYKYIKWLTGLHLHSKTANNIRT